jgi:hypothetical protein
MFPQQHIPRSELSLILHVITIIKEGKVDVDDDDDDDDDDDIISIYLSLICCLQL